MTEGRTEQGWGHGKRLGSVNVGEAVAAVGAVAGEGEELCLVKIVGGTAVNATLGQCAGAAVNGDLYLASGTFRAGTILRHQGRSAENLARVLWLPFDLDLADYLDCPKESLWDLPDAELWPLIERQRADAEEVFRAVGLPIHRLDYTGYGLCAYVRVAERDQHRVEDCRRAHRALVDRLNAVAGFRLCDPQVSDAGTRITRLPPCDNTKGAIVRRSRTLAQTEGAVPLETVPSEPRTPPRVVIPEHGAGLDEAALQAIVDAVRPSWASGYRHALALGLAGMFAKAGIPESQAEAAMLALSAGDEEARDRLKAVRTSYDRIRSGLAASGFTRLRELLPPETLLFVDTTLREVVRAQAATATLGASGPAPAGLALADFASYLPERKYIYLPTGKMWEPAGINKAFPAVTVGAHTVKAGDLVDEQCPVHDLTWAPGRPQIIEGAFLDQGGWIEKAGARVYNGYRAPRPSNGDPTKAGRWLSHVAMVYPHDVDRILDWLAHRVQRPGEKVNHALVLGGAQGIGKDTIIEPVREAVGPWNVGDVSPVEILGRFNAFLKNVILRVSELRDLGERDRYGFYEHTKTLIAAPPDTLLVDEKHVRAYRIPNLVGVIFTTNHRTDGLFLPAEDRRHYVAWSELTAGEIAADYWSSLYRWFGDDGEGGVGADHVAAFLATRDLAAFNPKAPPPKTAAFWDIVAAGGAPEDADLADAVARLGEPEALTVSDIERESHDPDFKAWLKDRKNARQLPYRFEAAGYVATRNPGAKDGLWVVNGRRQVVYARRELPIQQRVEAARKRTDRPW